MKLVYSATIYGDPIPYPRPRPRSRGKGYFNPKTKQMDTIANELALHKRGEMITEPCSMVVEFIRTPPKSWSKARREAAINDYIRPGTKPDLANYLKLIEDCLTRAGVWKDDSLVCHEDVTKAYGEVALTRVEIYTYD
jgi:Holliday junction resolvase RusA-like endonuclease